MTKHSTTSLTELLASLEKAMLPVGEDAYSQAVVSVFRRGFHDKPSGMSEDWMIMNQYLRLVEEVGEFQEAVMWQPSSESAMKELADVMIVLCQLAWLAGMDPAELADAKQVQKRAFHFGVGHLARCLRKDTTKDLNATQAAIKALAYQIHLRAKQFGCDIAAVMSAKCGDDEGRGYRHEGHNGDNGDSRLTKWATFEDVAAKATVTTVTNGNNEKVVDYGSPAPATVIS